MTTTNFIAREFSLTVESNLFFTKKTPLNSRELNGAKISGL